MIHSSLVRQSFWRNIAALLFLFTLAGAQSSLSAQCCNDFTLTAPAVQPDPLQCCVTISGRVPDNCLPVQWTIEQIAGGSAVQSGAVTDPLDTWVSETFCSNRADGPFQFRLVIKDMNGNELCSQNFDYDCNSNTCCAGFTFAAIPQTSSNPGECCFVLQGTKNPLCNFTSAYTLQENVGGTWVDSVVNQPLTGSGFTTPTFCNSTGSRTFRLILYTGTSGTDVYCVKELTYDCASCCDQIDLQMSSQVPVQGQCCYDVVINVPQCLPSGTIRRSELDVHGHWHAITPVISYYSGQQGISFRHCLQYDAAPARIRFDFYDQDGNLLCTQEKIVECQYTQAPDCCDSVTVTSHGQVTSPFNPTQCCFNFSVYLPSCMPVTRIQTRELRPLGGGWYVPLQAVVIQNPGQTLSYNPYCFTYDAAPARVAFDFFDQDGNLLCTKELSVDCQYGSGDNPGGILPHGKSGASSDDAATNTGIVQHLASTPNPVTDEATVSYTLSESADVSVELVDVLGQHIALQPATAQAHGVHALPFKTTTLPNGMYTVVVKANGQQTTINIVIAK